MLPASERAIQLQLNAMDADVFEIGARLPRFKEGKRDDRMIFYNGKDKAGLTAAEIVNNVDAVAYLDQASQDAAPQLDRRKLLDELAAKNAHGWHIYIRPFGPSRLTLIDDLTQEGRDRLAAEGYTPAAVIETSPGNFQAWLKHDRVLSPEEGTIAAKILAEKFGGDPSSADWKHFGRLAGFTNPKEKYQLPNGRYPFSVLDFKRSKGQGFPQAQHLYNQVQERLQEQRQEFQQAVKNRQAMQSWSGPQQQKVKPYSHFANMFSGEGQRHYADISYATHCFQRNVPEHEIRHTISTQTLTSSFVNRSKRDQESYLDRTLTKARRKAGITQDPRFQPRLQHQSSLSR